MFLLVLISSKSFKNSSRRCFTDDFIPDFAIFCKLKILCSFFSDFGFLKFSNFSFPSMLGCVQPHSWKLCSVKLNLSIVNIAGTSFTFLNSSGSMRYLESSPGISVSKKSRFHKVFNWRLLGRKLALWLVDQIESSFFYWRSKLTRECHLS